MSKMHLRARVPNEGARRLAWWIAHQPGGAYDALAYRVGGVIMLDRMLAGEVTPGRDVGYTIFSITGRAVAPTEWYREPEGRWFDEPAVRPERRAA